MISATKKDETILKNADMSIDEKMKYGLFYDEYKKFGVADLTSTGNLLTIETNWNKMVKNNQYLRLRIGDQIIVVRNEDLRSILKILAPLEEANEMLTYSKRFYTRKNVVLKIKSGAYYRPGDDIVFQVDLPERLV